MTLNTFLASRLVTQPAGVDPADVRRYVAAFLREPATTAEIERFVIARLPRVVRTLFAGTVRAAVRDVVAYVATLIEPEAPRGIPG